MDLYATVEAHFTSVWNFKQGETRMCAYSHPLNLFFTCILKHALQGLDRGVYLRYRLDGSLFDLQRQNAISKKTKRLVLDALFADDCAFMVHSDSDLQYDLLFQPAPGSRAPRPTITIEGTELKTVKHVKYIGSIISSDGSLDKEISVHISKASQPLCRLRMRVLNNRNIRLPTMM